MIQNPHQKTVTKRTLGQPINIRPYKDQRNRFDQYVKSENKEKVMAGNDPLKDSDYARIIFEVGLNALGVPDLPEEQ